MVAPILARHVLAGRANQHETFCKCSGLVATPSSRVTANLGAACEPSGVLALPAHARASFKIAKAAIKVVQVILGWV